MSAYRLTVHFENRSFLRIESDLKSDQEAAEWRRDTQKAIPERLRDKVAMITVEPCKGSESSVA